MTRTTRQSRTLDFDDDVLDRLLDMIATRLAEGILQRVDARLETYTSERRQRPSALDSREAAKRLGISDSTMRALAAEGKVQSFTVGRRRLFAVSHLDDFIARGGIRE